MRDAPGTAWDWNLNHVGAAYGMMDEVFKFVATFKEFPRRTSWKRGFAKSKPDGSCVKHFHSLLSQDRPTERWTAEARSSSAFPLRHHVAHSHAG
jgi:hypothetical protein